MPRIRGFGLVQRDRDFDHYQDLETRAELRPSAWVAPHGDWGDGPVELVEIPTKSDTNDNVVAYWVPENAAEAGQGRASSAYTLVLVRRRPDAAARAAASSPPVATAADKENAQRFVVDFAGKKLEAIPGRPGAARRRDRRLGRRRRRAARPARGEEPGDRRLAADLPGPAAAQRRRSSCARSSTRTARRSPRPGRTPWRRDHQRLPPLP